MASRATMNPAGLKLRLEPAVRHPARNDGQPAQGELSREFHLPEPSTGVGHNRVEFLHPTPPSSGFRESSRRQPRYRYILLAGVRDDLHVRAELLPVPL